MNAARHLCPHRFPGLETEEELAAHRAAAADFIRQGGALCAKDGSRVVGALLFSREPSVLCFLAVDPVYRRRHIASRLVQTMLTCLPPERDVTVTTYRAGVPRGYRRKSVLYPSQLRRRRTH